MASETYSSMLTTLILLCSSNGHYNAIQARPPQGRNFDPHPPWLVLAKLLSCRKVCWAAVKTVNRGRANCCVNFSLRHEANEKDATSNSTSFKVSFRLVSMLPRCMIGREQDTARN